MSSSMKCTPRVRGPVRKLSSVPGRNTVSVITTWHYLGTVSSQHVSFKCSTHHLRTTEHSPSREADSSSESQEIPQLNETRCPPRVHKTLPLVHTLRLQIHDSLQQKQYSVHKKSMLIETKCSLRRICQHYVKKSVLFTKYPNIWSNAMDTLGFGSYQTHITPITQKQNAPFLAKRWAKKTHRDWTNNYSIPGDANCLGVPQYL